MLQFTGKVVGIDPGLGAVIGVIFRAVIHETEPQPDTGHHMADINNDEDETGETTEIILSLL